MKIRLFHVVTLLGLTLCAALPALSAEESRFPNNEDLRHSRTMDSPRLSPDGNRSYKDSPGHTSGRPADLFMPKQDPPDGNVAIARHRNNAAEWLLWLALWPAVPVVWLIQRVRTRGC